MTLKTAITAVLAAAAMAAPTASAMPLDRIGLSPGSDHAVVQDMRSPDASTTGYWPEPPVQDLRTPDSQDGLKSPAQRNADVWSEVVAKDLRTPDAIDSAVTPARDVTVVEIPQHGPSASGFDWENAGLGAGVTLALGLLALAGAYVFIKRRSVPIA